MHKVIILRALPWGRDARAQRWAAFYTHYTPLYGVWGAAFPPRVQSVTAFPRNPANKLMIGLGYLLFSIKCFFFVMKYAQKNDVVICIDLETVLCAWMGVLFKKAKLHYDMADPFYLAKPVPCSMLWKFLEKKFVKYSPRVTAPHRARLLLFADNIEKNMFVIENVPDFKIFARSFEFNECKEHCIVLGYFGSLEKSVRGLEKIIALVKQNEQLKITIAGDGELKTYIMDQTKKCDRISYLGPYDYKKLPDIVKNIHVYFAYYSPDKRLHTIAAPNKYYEHLFLGKPILTTRIIPQSDDICRNRTGWCVDDEDGLSTWKDMILDSPIDWEGYRVRCNEIWRKRYANYASMHQMN